MNREGEAVIESSEPVIGDSELVERGSWPMNRGSVVVYFRSAFV
jgi:hypothetical protein